MTLKTNDLKKEDRILLRNGWYGTIKDNMKGDTRLAEVEGYHTEIGSVYSHDIMYLVVNNLPVERLEHTEKQLKLKQMVEEMF